MEDSRAAFSRSSFDGGVALLSPAGWGNLGDAAILDSALHAVCTRLPGAPVVALTLNPRDTAVRHGVPALTLSGFSRPYYGVTEYGPVLVTEPDIEPGPADEELPWRWRTGLREALAVPLALWSIARAVPRELSHRRRVGGATARLRHVIVAGGGQIDDFWGGAFGHPYVLWRWAAHARATGARCAFLSVGTGSLDTPAARRLAWRALGLADYRSFRDEGSRSLVGSPLVASDPIVPDLAYGLPVSADRDRSPRTGGPRLIGISPIAYGDPRVWPTPDAARYRHYLERLATVAVRLLAGGSELVLFGTDGPDLVTVRDLKAEIARRAPASDLERVRTPLVRSLDQLFAALSGAHAVIASRLHGVILTQLVGIPVLALSYERKVRTHMHSLEQDEFCLSIDDFTPEAALERFEELSVARERVAAATGEIFARRRGAVEAQYDAVFGPVSAAGSPAVSVQ